MLGDGLGDTLDLASLVGGNDGEDKMIHADDPLLGKPVETPVFRGRRESIGKARQPAAGVRKIKSCTVSRFIWNNPYVFCEHTPSQRDPMRPNGRRTTYLV